MRGVWARRIADMAWMTWLVMLPPAATASVAVAVWVAGGGEWACIVEADPSIVPVYCASVFVWVSLAAPMGAAHLATGVPIGMWLAKRLRARGGSTVPRTWAMRGLCATCVLWTAVLVGCDLDAHGAWGPWLPHLLASSLTAAMLATYAALTLLPCALMSAAGAPSLARHCAERSIRESWPRGAYEGVTSSDGGVRKAM